MDTITHGLFAYSILNIVKMKRKGLFFVLFLGALIPDLGEFLIQNELSLKYGEVMAVYDSRTSDVKIASDLSITFLYDTLHSFVLPISLFIISFFISNRGRRKVIHFFSLGLLSHILLDSFTHGKVWALKLFFPMSSYRFQILPDLVGNWWDWKPQIDLIYFKFPIYCIIIWFVFVSSNLILYIARAKFKTSI